jgi:hypothetical protein
MTLHLRLDHSFEIFIMANLYQFLKYSLLLGFLCTFSACSEISYQNDFKADTDFSHLKTYQWRNLSLDTITQNQITIQQIADAQLLTQGYRRVNDKADLWLDLQTIVRQRKQGSTQLGIGIGLPVGRHGNIGLGTGQTLPLGKKQQEATLIVDMTRTDNNQLIWRGTAEAIPLSYFSLKEEQHLRETLNKLLAQFPPMENAH